MTMFPAAHRFSVRAVGFAAAVALVLAGLAACGSTDGTATRGDDAGAAQGAPATAPTESPDSPDGDGSPEDSAPTSGELIDAALAAGDIDDTTALAYRAWALFGDRALPEKFRGAPGQHPVSLVAHLQDSLDDLPGDLRGGVEPLLRRPTDPASAFTANDGDAPSLRSPVRAADSSDPARCTSGWESRPVDGQPFRVWACADETGAETGADGAATDTTSAAGARPVAALDLVAGHLAEIAPAVIADMGEPKPDDPAAQGHPQADDSIDVYVLPRGWFAPYRDGGTR